MTIKKINAKIKQINMLKQDINALILSLPDNPKFKYIPGSNNAGTINMSDSEGIFCVFYHNFRDQYEKITDIINETRTENIPKTLEKLMTSNKHGAHWYRKGDQSYRFHPDVIKNVMEIL